MGRLLLTLSVLLVAIIFMGTSFVVATNRDGQFMASGRKSNANATSYTQNGGTYNA